MWQPFLLAIVLLCESQAGKQSYAGPNALGLFRIDRDVFVRSLFERLGQPTTTKSNHFCYQSRSANSYLWFDRMAHEPGQVGDLLLSDFPNCMDRPVQVVSEDLGAWKTEEGIRLGSTAEEVLKAYGRPSSRDKIERTAYRWVIQGDYIARENRYTNKARPERGDRVLVYTSPHELRTAEFGIRSGRVAWIFLSQNE